VVLAAIVGARLVHVIANASFYANNPGDIFAIWHGGLSSFGGLLFAVPVGIVLARRRCPELPTSRALDLVAPVLVAAWGVGRLLGPQLMVNGGGHPTTAWYGLEYAGQVGKRIPVPIFQSLECFAIFGILLLVERWVPRRPVGLITALGVGLWSVTRFTDEFFWLAVPRLWDAVEVVALILAASGLITAAVLWRRQPHIDMVRPDEAQPEPGASPEVPATTSAGAQPSGAN
jgi:phosphatidylglycerol:prolipoprotein diacylglycerol transferase